MAKDVVVTIDARKPAPLTGLGKPLILAQKTGTSFFRNYSSIEAVAVDFPTNTATYKKAFAALGQNTKPATIAIATYDSAAVAAGEPKTAAEAIAKYYYHDWFFLLLTNDVQAEQIAVGDYVEAKKSKIMAIKTPTTTARDAIKAKAYKYVINFYHTVADEMPDAAVVGELGSKTVGSITWKFKALTGITPLENVDLDEIHAAGAIVYTRKNGRAETSEGITVSGDYIDNVHGEQWVILEITKNVQNLFSQTDKVPYDHRGIEMIAGVTRTAIKRGHTNGIVAEDEAKNPVYTVSAIPRSESPAADRGARIYNGVSFYFEGAGAIHGAGIKGEVVY